MENDNFSSDSTELVPTFITASDVSVIDKDQYGHTLKRSTLCVICRHHQLRDINLARARDYKSIQEISSEFNIPPDIVRKHFDNHYILSSTSQKAIKIKEDTSPEAKEVISKIFDGNVDILEGSESVLKSKAARLNIITNKILEMSDRSEIDALDEDERLEFLALHRVAEEIENSIMKVYQVIDKKLFPARREDLMNAILSYKMNYLSKMIDETKLVLLEFKKKPEYVDLINVLIGELAKRFNKLEEEILRSGGMVRPESPVIETTEMVMSNDRS